MEKKLYLVVLLIPITLSAFNFIDNKTRDGFLQEKFIQEVANTFKADFFIETGTYDGTTAKTAAPYFKQVHTVELHPDLYAKAKSTLAIHRNVRVYHDSSPAMIKKIAPTLDGPIIFWLDAHYSGEKTAMSNDNPYDPQAITPILQELEAIKESNLKNCTILIDDIRGFGTIINGTEFLGCWAYPSIQKICSLGKKINPNFSFALLGDTLMMYDHTNYSPTLSPTIKACTESRLYNGGSLTDEQLLAHEAIIMSAPPYEKQFITELYKKMTDYKDPMFHHDLWYGLVSMGSKNWNDALIALKKVPNRLEYYSKKRQKVNTVLEYNHWRMAKYLEVIENRLEN